MKFKIMELKINGRTIHPGKITLDQFVVGILISVVALLVLEVMAFLVKIAITFFLKWLFVPIIFLNAGIIIYHKYFKKT